MPRSYTLNPAHPAVAKTGTAAVGKQYFKAGEIITGDNYHPFTVPTATEKVPLLIFKDGKPDHPTPQHHPTETREHFLARKKLHQLQSMQGQKMTENAENPSRPHRQAEWAEPAAPLGAPVQPGAPKSIKASDAEVARELATLNAAIADSDKVAAEKAEKSGQKTPAQVSAPVRTESMESPRLIADIPDPLVPATGEKVEPGTGDFAGTVQAIAAATEGPGAQAEGTGESEKPAPTRQSSSHSKRR